MGTSTVGQPATGISVASLRESVRGQLLTVGDEGYDQARVVHNGMFDKRPLAVLRAEQVADVIAAVRTSPAITGSIFPFVTGGTAHPVSVPTMAAWSSICRRCIACVWIRGTGRPGPMPAPRGVTSTMPPTPSGWRRRVASSRPPASLA